MLRVMKLRLYVRTNVPKPNKTIPHPHYLAYYVYYVCSSECECVIMCMCSSVCMCVCAWRSVFCAQCEFAHKYTIRLASLPFTWFYTNMYMRMIFVVGFWSRCCLNNNIHVMVFVFARKKHMHFYIQYFLNIQTYSLQPILESPIHKLLQRHISFCTRIGFKPGTVQTCVYAM